MVRAVKIGIGLAAIGYLVAILYIFIIINLKQHQGCGIPPIQGCIEHSSRINYTPESEPTLTIDARF